MEQMPAERLSRRAPKTPVERGELGKSAMKGKKKNALCT